MDDDPWGEMDQPETVVDESEILEQDTGPSLISTETENHSAPVFSEDTHESWNHPFNESLVIPDSVQSLPLKINTLKTMGTYFFADSRYLHHVMVSKEEHSQLNVQTQWTLSKDEIVGFRHFNSEQLRSFSQLWSLLLVALIITTFLTIFSAIEGLTPMIFCLLALGIPWSIIYLQVQYIVLYGPRRKYRFVQWIWNHDAHLSRISMKHFGTMMRMYLSEGEFRSDEFELEVSYRPKQVEKPPRQKRAKNFEAESPIPIQSIASHQEPSIPVGQTPISNQPQPLSIVEQPTPPAPLDGPPIQQASSESPIGPPLSTEPVVSVPPPAPTPSPPTPVNTVSSQGPPLPPLLTAMPGPPTPMAPPPPPSPPNPPAPLGMPVPPGPPHSPMHMGPPAPPPSIPTIPPPLPPPPMVVEPTISTEEQQALLDELS